MQNTFIIGGKEYPVKITYRIKRHFSESYAKKPAGEIMPTSEYDDICLNAILMALPKETFTDIEALKDVIEWDEYDALEKFFREKIINNAKIAKEAMSEVEKKPEEM